MKIITELYIDSIQRVPKRGQFILAHQTDEFIVVYQAYKNDIADFAVRNQVLGGDNFSYSRMSWIKPNFLWMMYRSGWAKKENQERILALWIRKQDFENILDAAVFSSFNPTYYESQDAWRSELNSKEIRLQWDPDHDPFGNKVERRAIQLGLKGKALEIFGKEQIRRIEDVTDFVKEQKEILDSNRLDKIEIPIENIYRTANEKINAKIGLE